MARLTETIKLPTNGKIYPTKEITIQSLTVNEIKSLYSASGEEGLYRCIQGCITNEGIDIKNLTLEDMAYILLKIRALTFGNKYEINLKCNNIIIKKGETERSICDTEFPYTIEISKIPNYILDDNFKTEIKLPECGDTIKIRFATPNQQKFFNEEKDDLAKKLQVDKNEFNFVCNIAQKIDAIGSDTELPLLQVYDYVNKLSAKDAFYLDDYVNNIKCGPQLDFEATCPSCGHTIKFLMPMNLEFFRPQTR